MPSASSGRIVKARRGKKLTTTHKTHRWESFSSKISKLHSLDPLRRVRRHDLDAEDVSATTSYLHNGLERWSELNVSRSYAAFRRQVEPLTESLAQILHFEDRIMELLAEHIGKQEKESLEPLLDLLTAFAHDLGARFEKHYPRALELIVAVAARPQDVEVIEWTFAALAFLFKYLSRLIVPDLRPTYDVVAPLLGRAKNPGHIARFAAEAMSFLVKKAAAPGSREKALPLLVEHARRDLQGMAGTRHFSLYSQGLMTMFAEAIKSAGNAVHSAGPETLLALVDAVPTDELQPGRQTVWTDVCCGVLTSIVHHSTADTFAAMEQTIVQATIAAADGAGGEGRAFPGSRMPVFTRLLGTAAGVRRATRVSQWPALVRALSRALEALAGSAEGLKEAHVLFLWEHVVASAAIVWSLAPMDALIPSISQFMGAMTKEPLIRCYIPFCSYFADLNPDRFHSLFQKHFERFIMAHWSDTDNEEMLCTLIPRMVETGAIPPAAERESCVLPQSWQGQIVSKFERLEVTPFPERGSYDKRSREWRDKCLPKYSALLQVLESTTVHPSTHARIAELLLRKLKMALKPSPSPSTDEANFIVSHGFRAYLRMTRPSGTVDASIGPLLRAATPRFCHVPGFLESLLAYEGAIATLDKGGEPTADGDERAADGGEASGPLVESLVRNLSAPSHELRLASLRILETLESTPDQNFALANMLQVEQTPTDLHNARAISAHLRKLGQAYGHLDGGSWLRRAVPSFLFGMMTVRLSPVWDDAVDALKQVAADKAGEEEVAALAFDWLEVPSPRWSGPSRQLLEPARKPMTDFECLNLMRLRESAGFTSRVLSSPPDMLLQTFEGRQETVPPRPDNARTRALKILSALPAVAEKRSRRLVPHLLSWTSDGGEAPGEEEEEEGGHHHHHNNHHPAEGGWSLSDRKALVGVFAQFVNPRVLYQSRDVYRSLLRLVANGDVEVQKPALRAVLAWKQEGVRPYQESLEYLLDEARFKNELTTIFQGGEGGEGIRPEHRAELMPVLLRLLYGRTISKKGAASGRAGLHATRLAVIRSLSVEDMGTYLDIALGDLRDVRVVDDARGVREATFARELIPARKQVGLLNMVETIINELGTSVDSYMEPIVNAVLYCLFWASRQLRDDGGDGEDDGEDDGGDGDEDDEDEEPAATPHTSLYRVARTTALKSLCKLFQNNQAFDWTPYQRAIVGEAISPRIEKLPAETTQGVSWTLRLLATWSVLPRPSAFFTADGRILPKITECLAMAKTKDEVKMFALTIVRSLVRLALAPATECERDELIRSELLGPNVDLVLERIGRMLREQHDMGRPLLEAAIETVVDLAPVTEDSKSVGDMVEITTYLLAQPPRRVSPKVKGSILLILRQFITRDEVQADARLKSGIYDTIAPLFGYFRDRENRQALSELLAALASREPTLQEVARLCLALNSYAERRLDEPDYNRRLAAFSAVSAEREVPFTARQWKALLHNMVHFIRQDEEFGILSTNSADGICRFVEAARSSWDGPERGAYEGLLSSVVLPEIYAGAREESETVRREHLRVFGFLASHLRAWPPVADVAAALAPEEPEEEEEEEEEGDDADAGAGADADAEAASSFFFHILSPAVARQLQALRLLQRVNDRAELQSKNVSQFFIPLLEHFVFHEAAESGGDQGLAAQATDTIGRLVLSLEWQQYRALLRRFVSYVESKPDSQKRVVRLLERIVDSLRAAVPDGGGDGPDGSGDDPMDVEDDRQAAAAAAAAAPPPPPRTVARRRLAATLPGRDKMSDEITGSALPTLLKHLHDKDEATVSARVPVGVIIVKLLRLLPGPLLHQKLPGVLTDICHILRSKAWEAREMARETLAKICRTLGAESFGFVVKELRGALTKGYQLHVLSYTLHSLLLAVIPSISQGQLDYCLPPIVSVIMDDIFGATGQEKDAEEYASKMKEVKSSKSQDSMELVAKNASVARLADLVRPLQQLLLEKLDLRMVRKIEDLLGRVTSGLLQNPAAGSRDTLVFAYEVIQEVYDSRRPEAARPRMDAKLRRYLVQKGARRSDRGTTSKHTHKLVRFAIDVVRSVTRKHDGLRTAANMAGFVPVLGDAVVAGEEEVRTAAFKLLAVLAKMPWDKRAGEFEGLYKVAAKEAIRGISESPATSADAAQAALKLVSVLLRDRREIAIKDAAVDVLLRKLRDDLTEPLHRHVTFSFLRSVLDRRVETALVYDTLDHVGTVMITNDDKDTRDLARGAFFQFLRDYPQKKGRWARQLAFIIANLKYEREGGRLSVMEVIHLLLMKSADDFVQEVAAACFIPLVFVVANDDSEKCRLAAGGLVREILARADRERLQGFTALLRSWIRRDDSPAVLGLAVRAFGLYFEAREPSDRDHGDVALVLRRITDVLGAPPDVGDVDGELADAALRTLQVLLERHPQKILARESRDLWGRVRACLSHPHGTVRLAAVRLLSAYLADFARGGGKADAAAAQRQALAGSHGLHLDAEDMFGLARATLGILGAAEVDEALAEEAARMLVFLGGHLESHVREPAAEEEEEEDAAEDDDEGAERSGGGGRERRTGLGYLLWRLAGVIRRETRPEYAALVPKLAAMEVVEALCATAATEALRPSLRAVLRPLRNLGDPAIPTPSSADEAFRERHEGLKARAQAVMDRLQRRLGTAEYTRYLLAVSEDVRGRRELRSGKRKIEAVTQPEKFGRDKRKKLEKKKERRKEKGRQHRDVRRGY